MPTPWSAAHAKAMTNSQKQPHAYGSTFRGIIFGLLGLGMFASSANAIRAGVADYTNNLFHLSGAHTVLGIVGLVLTAATAWMLFTEPRNPGRKLAMALGLTTVGLALAIPNGIDAMTALGAIAFLVGADTYRPASTKFFVPWAVLVIASTVENVAYLEQGSAKTGSDLVTDFVISSILQVLLMAIFMAILFIVGRWWQKHRDARLAG